MPQKVYPLGYGYPPHQNNYQSIQQAPQHYNPLPNYYQQQSPYPTPPNHGYNSTAQQYPNQSAPQYYNYPAVPQSYQLGHHQIVGYPSIIQQYPQPQQHCLPPPHHPTFPPYNGYSCTKMTSRFPSRCHDTTTTSDVELPAFRHLANFPLAKQQKKCVMCNTSKFNIPNQNKSVCNNCDSVIWIVNSSGILIKWCKGCKNFQKLDDFGDKV